MYKIRQIKWALQRLVRGYGDDDLWDFDSYVTLKMRKPFKAFVKYQKKYGVGCPAALFDEKNEIQQCQKWLDILDKIELAFDLHYSEITFSKEYENKTAKQNIKDAEKVQEGFELFGKHYQSLWD